MPPSSRYPLRQTARRILEVEAKRFGVSLDTGDVLLRQAEGGPELHVVAAAEELLMHLITGETRSLTTASWSWRRLGADADDQGGGGHAGLSAPQFQSRPRPGPRRALAERRSPLGSHARRHSG
jgi:hypothetical protein